MTLPLLAVLKGLEEPLLRSQKVDFMRNKLASGLSGGTLSSTAFGESLLCLNCVLLDEELKLDVLPRQRALFLTEALLKSMKDIGDNFICTEGIKVITRLLPILKSEYGSFWQKFHLLVMDALKRVIIATLEETVPLQYACLRAMAWMTANRDSNDDLSEAWSNGRKAMESLIVDLYIADSLLDHRNQPSVLCTSLVSRLMNSIPASLLDAAQSRQMYRIMSVGPNHMQETAFLIQQQVVKLEQEQMTLQSALVREYEEVEARLPDELLSVILDVPDLDEEYLSDPPEQISGELRGYFMAWMIIFRFFDESSLRVRVKLTEILEEGSYIEPLLAISFETLKIGSDRPVDISGIAKEKLTTEIGNSRGELVAFTTHLYYLLLVHVPSLVRAWWIQCTDRSLSTALESLTERHFSPLLVQRELTSVCDNSKSMAIDDDRLTIKVSNGAREVLSTFIIGAKQARRL